MPATRYVEEYKSGTDTPVLLRSVPYTVSDAQLATEQESAALARANTLIDAIGNLTDAKAFLKRLCARLIRNGVLP